VISQELNERLTQTGPGTPLGNLLRRYWHPVGAMAELEKEPVQPVRLLGKKLTLFRSSKGELGPHWRPLRPPCHLAGLWDPNWRAMDQ